MTGACAPPHSCLVRGSRDASSGSLASGGLPPPGAFALAVRSARRSGLGLAEAVGPRERAESPRRRCRRAGDHGRRGAWQDVPDRPSDGRPRRGVHGRRPGPRAGRGRGAARPERLRAQGRGAGAPRGSRPPARSPGEAPARGPAMRPSRRRRAPHPGVVGLGDREVRRPRPRPRRRRRRGAEGRPGGPARGPQQKPLEGPAARRDQVGAAEAGGGRGLHPPSPPPRGRAGGPVRRGGGARARLGVGRSAAGAGPARRRLPRGRGGARGAPDRRRCRARRVGGDARRPFASAARRRALGSGRRDRAGRGPHGAVLRASLDAGGAGRVPVLPVAEARLARPGRTRLGRRGAGGRGGRRGAGGRGGHPCPGGVQGPRTARSGRTPRSGANGERRGGPGPWPGTRRPAPGPRSRGRARRAPRRFARVGRRLDRRHDGRGHGDRRRDRLAGGAVELRRRSGGTPAQAATPIRVGAAAERSGTFPSPAVSAVPAAAERRPSGDASAPPASLAAPSREWESDARTLYERAVDLAMEDPEAAIVAYARAALRGHARSARYLGQI